MERKGRPAAVARAGDARTGHRRARPLRRSAYNGILLSFGIAFAPTSVVWGQLPASDAGKANAAGALKMPLPPQTTDALRAKAATAQGTDLVVERVEWRYSPPGSIAGIPVVFGAVGAFAGKVVKAASGAMRGDKEPPSTRVVAAPSLEVTIRNAGSSRWASEGRVVAYVKMGTPEELDARPSDATKRVGLQVVNDVKPFGHLVAIPPFGGQREIPFSLAPGESRTIAVPIRGSREQDKLAMSVDKFYTARIDIQAKGEDHPTNNGADYVFRIDYAGQALEPSMRARRTDASARGTVEVGAPPRR